MASTNKEDFKKGELPPHGEISYGDYHLTDEALHDPGHISELRERVKWMNDEELAILRNQLIIVTARIGYDEFVSHEEYEKTRQYLDEKIGAAKEEVEEWEKELQNQQKTLDVYSRRLNKIIPCHEKVLRKRDDMKMVNTYKLARINKVVEQLKLAADALMPGFKVG